VIGKPGAELEATIAKLEQDIFFLTEPEVANWKEIGPSQPAACEWTAVEREKGYVVFPADYTEPIAPTFVPAAQRSEASDCLCTPANSSRHFSLLATGIW